ncbi:hypothetical protein JTE90_022745 [Oedothorax gibbosus]|uniref:Uncharacterized protein n=1 Tax=Oedothorax gibbosus TaxID=931172 RepID=A0AAV6UQZ8_9ARAC|nr:hypothetical protein JTE90_022745 [Oedothorax gibbosus]
MNLLLAQMDDPQNHLYGEPPHPNILRNIAKLDVLGTDQDGNTQLHLVLSDLKLDENVVKELLDLGAPVNAENNLGQTPLHYALLHQNGELPIIKLLVSKKANVNKDDEEGFGPLVYALMNANCSTDVIKFLCDRGADVNVVDKSGYTLLHHASSNRKLSLEVFKMLLNKGVSAHTVNMYGETALHRAVQYSRKEVVGLLLKIPKIKVNLFNERCFTPLHLAVRDPNTDPGIIKLLLKAGAIIHKKTQHDQQCLHLAAYHCNPTHIKILLDYGARGR